MTPPPLCPHQECSPSLCPEPLAPHPPSPYWRMSARLTPSSRPLPSLFVAFLPFFVLPWPSPIRVINVIIIDMTGAAPPERQTVYYAHTCRAVVATHELYMQEGDHTFIRPLLPLYDAVRTLAPPGDAETCALIGVRNKVRTINEFRHTDLRLVVHSGQRSRVAGCSREWRCCWR